MTKQIQRLKWPLISLVAGAVMTLALPPYELWPFLFIGFSLFFVSFSKAESKKQSFIRGWCFGFGYFAVGLWWIANALLVEGNPFSWVWPFAIAGLPALLALFPALACYACSLTAKPKTLHSFSCFVVFLALSEYLRGHIFTGFPWNLYGYGWSGSLEMLQSVSLGGSYSLTFLTIFWGSLAGFLYVGNTKKTYKTLIFICGIASIIGNYNYGALRLERIEPRFHDSVAVRIIQPNIKQEDKWNNAKITQNIRQLISLSAPDEITLESRNKTVFIIWPETAVTERILHHPLIKEELKETLNLYTGDVYLVTGILRQENGQFFNSLSVFNKKVELIETYNKSHLVPFGEYVPLKNILALQPFVQLSGFTKGKGLKNISINDSPPFSPLICYEVIFPGKITKSDDSYSAQWAINVTNDAWYGISPGPYQHFHQTQMRAIEEGIPIIRAANTGFSGIILPSGKITSQSSLFKEWSYASDIPMNLEEKTFFTKNKNYFLFIILAFATICVALRFLKR